MRCHCERASSCNNLCNWLHICHCMLSMCVHQCIARECKCNRLVLAEAILHASIPISLLVSRLLVIVQVFEKHILLFPSDAGLFPGAVLHTSEIPVRDLTTQSNCNPASVNGNHSASRQHVSLHFCLTWCCSEKQMDDLVSLFIEHYNRIIVFAVAKDGTFNENSAMRFRLHIYTLIDHD